MRSTVNLGRVLIVQKHRCSITIYLFVVAVVLLFCSLTSTSVSRRLHYGHNPDIYCPQVYYHASNADVQPLSAHDHNPGHGCVVQHEPIPRGSRQFESFISGARVCVHERYPSISTCARQWSIPIAAQVLLPRKGNCVRSQGACQAPSARRDPPQDPEDAI